MKKSILIVASFLSITLATERVSAQTATDTAKKTTTTTTTITTTAAAPAPVQDVATILTTNPDYSTAASAVKTAGIDASLKSTGPYTVFAPNNAAFSKLSPGARDSLMKNPAKLAATVKGHVVNGRFTKADIIKALKDGKGKATLTTLDGQTLTLSVSPNRTLQLTNNAGSSAEVSVYDMVGSNGVVNGINGVLMPK